jgi:GNAT superfamily N-acetyltransferase
MTRETVEIRTAAAGDSAGIAERLAEFGYETPPDQVVSRLQDLSDAGAAVFVAACRDRVLGVVTVQKNSVLHRREDDARITSLVVAAAARRQGLGRRLVMEAERWAQAAACRRIEATSGNARVEAHEFYKRLGYEQSSLRFSKPFRDSYQSVQPADPGHALNYAEFQIVKANLSNTDHQDAILAMMDAYSKDPMGDGKPLSEFARLNLINGLRAHPTTLVFLALEGAMPRGIATCFGGFSTFAARPLINISDFYVAPEFRGRGLGRSLLAAIEREARDKGCCKLTLEVQENNPRARSIYGRFGFAQAVYAADMTGGGSIYMVKPLS